MAAQLDNLAPERFIQSEWAPLLNPAPQLSSSVVTVDDDQRPLPKNALLIDSLFSGAECEALIGAAESSAGFGYTNYRKEYRGNLRLTTTDTSLASRVWDRIQPFVPPRLSGLDGMDGEWQAVGLNECWRLAKYFPGDKFMSHYDASFARDSFETSVYTVNIYMNGGFGGGRTRFFDALRKGTEVAAVTGEAGKCLVFMQPPGALLAHDGEEVSSGLKYLFRSDIMYRRVDAPTRISPEDETANKAAGSLLHEAECHEAAGPYKETIASYTTLRQEHPEFAARAGVV